MNRYRVTQSYKIHWPDGDSTDHRATCYVFGDEGEAPDLALRKQRQLMGRQATVSATGEVTVELVSEAEYMSAIGERKLF